MAAHQGERSSRRRAAAWVVILGAGLGGCNLLTGADELDFDSSPSGAGGASTGGIPGATTGAGGSTPEGCAAADDPACYSGPAGTENVGTCAAGTRTCSEGTWGPCEGDIVPAAEECNGLDDDCNGLVDDGFATTTCGLGTCAVTVDDCADGAPQSCTPLPGNAVEQCDGLDDDCDGEVDEGCDCIDGTTQPCYGADPATEDVGPCKGGTQTCAGGQWGACQGEVQPVAEKCNGVDDDCDGAIDEGNPGSGVSCSSGKLGVCAAGTTTCQNGAIVCAQSKQPVTEICGNGLDDDCDGMIDEGCHKETTTNAGGTGQEPGKLIPVCCVPSAVEKARITEGFNLLNQHRLANGKSALAYDTKLEASIEAHVHHEAIHTFFSHTAPEASVSSPWTRANLCGTSANAENLFYGSTSAQSAMNAWINSPGHNTNMLGGYKRVGIGNFNTQWGQLFGN